jgi:hypothetical protein
MSDRLSALDSIKAQMQGVTPSQQNLAAYCDLIAALAKRCGAKRVSVCVTTDGAVSVDYDFEGLEGCG